MADDETPIYEGIQLRARGAEQASPTSEPAITAALPEHS